METALGKGRDPRGLHSSTLTGIRWAPDRDTIVALGSYLLVVAAL